MKSIDVYTLEQELGAALERIAELEERCDKARAHANAFGQRHGAGRDRPSHAEEGRFFEPSAEVEEIKRGYAIARDTGVPYAKVREIINAHESVVGLAQAYGASPETLREPPVNVRCQLEPKLGDEVEFVEPHRLAGARGRIGWIGKSTYFGKYVKELGVTTYGVTRDCASGRSYVTRCYFRFV